MLSNQQKAVAEAVGLAVKKLKAVNMAERCKLHGLEISAGNKIRMRVFEQAMELDINDFSSNIKPADLLLVLHYLLCEVPVKKSGELVSFREFPGGQFYYEPFLARTVKPVIAKYGNAIGSLKKSLAKFAYKEIKLGDFGAEIQAFGPFEITFVYRLGDAEFPAAAEVLFDSACKRVFEAEDAAVIAGRICLGLLF